MDACKIDGSGKCCACEQMKTPKGALRMAGRLVVFALRSPIRFARGLLAFLWAIWGEHMRIGRKYKRAVLSYDRALSIYVRDSMLDKRGTLTKHLIDMKMRCHGALGHAWEAQRLKELLNGMREGKRINPGLVCRQI